MSRSKFYLTHLKINFHLEFFWCKKKENGSSKARDKWKHSKTHNSLLYCLLTRLLSTIKVNNNIIKTSCVRWWCWRRDNKQSFKATSKKLHPKYVSSLFALILRFFLLSIYTVSCFKTTKTWQKSLRLNLLKNISFVLLLTFKFIFSILKMFFEISSSISHWKINLKFYEVLRD